MSGKGSRQRPTDESKYHANWDRIFKANEPTKGPDPVLAKEPGMATECIDCPDEVATNDR